MNPQREAVVREAKTWLGTPWRHAARVKRAGVDCGQLLIAVFSSAGLVEAFPTDAYPQDWALHRSEERFLGYVERFAHKVVGRLPLPGDVALFRYGRCVSHAGIFVGEKKIIHAYLEARAVVYDDIKVNADLSRRYVGAWSYWED